MRWSPKGCCCCLGGAGQSLGKIWELMEFLAFIIVRCASEQWVTSNSCCFSRSWGTLTLLGFWFTHSISIQWDLWPSLSSLISSRTGSVRWGCSTSPVLAGGGIWRWFHTAASHLVGQDTTSTQFLFSKSVKVCYETNLLLAQRQPGDNKWTSAPSSEGGVSTQT